MKTFYVWAVFVGIFCAPLLADDYSGRKRGVGGNFQAQRKIFFNDTYFLGENGFFDVGDNLRVYKLEDTVYNQAQEIQGLRQEINLLRQELQSLLQILQNLQQNPPRQGPDNGGGLVPPGNGGIPLPNPNPVPIPTEPGSNLDNKVGALFLEHCAACHTEGEAKKIVLITQKGTLANLTVDDIKKVRVRTTFSSVQLKELGLQAMPIGSKLNPFEIDLIKDWAKAKTGTEVRYFN